MAKAKAKPAPEKDTATGRFQPGNNGGPGRPKGSRNKLGETFLADMLADWEEHGPETIQMVRIERPDAYLKVVASILPKELNVNVNELEELSDEDLDRRLKSLAATLAQYEVGNTSAGDGASEADQGKSDSDVSSVH